MEEKTEIELTEPFIKRQRKKTIDSSHIDPDKVMSALGKFARYQLFSVLLIDLSWYMFAFVVLAMAFIGEAPPFACVEESEIPYMNVNETYIFDSNCTVRNLDDSEFTCGTNGTKYVFDENFGETLASEFNLVCEKAPVVQLGTSLFMIGTATTLIIISQLADRYGRRWVFLISIWLTSAFCLLSAFCPTFTTFAIVRFLMGVSIVGVQTVSWILACEMVAPEIRIFIGMIGNCVWVFAYCLTGILAMYVPNWRTFTVIASIPMLISVSFYWLLPESLYWLIAKDKVTEARQWIERAERLNGVKVDITQCLETYIEDDAKVKRHLGHIFKSPALTFHVATFSFISICVSLLYWGLTLFSTQLSEDRFTGYILSGLIELPAGFIGPLFLICFGRKPVGLCSFLLTGFSLLALAFVPLDAPMWIIMVLSLVAKFGTIVMFSATFLLMTEIVPTTVRNVAFGFIGTVGKIGSIISPYIGILSNYDRSLPPLILGILCLICAALHICFPESRGRELPEDIDDTQLGPVLTYFRNRKQRNEK